MHYETHPTLYPPVRNLFIVDKFDQLQRLRSDQLLRLTLASYGDGETCECLFCTGKRIEARSWSTRHPRLATALLVAGWMAFCVAMLALVMWVAPGHTESAVTK